MGTDRGAGGAAAMQAGDNQAAELATLRARAAAAGWQVSAWTDAAGCTTYTASRWGRARTLESLPELAAFLRQVGAVQ